MTRLCLTAVMALWPVMAPADAARGVAALPVTPVETDTLRALRWQARPVLVLGPQAQVWDQIAALQAQAAALADRDVVLLTDGPGADALDTGAGFRVLLIGKDGGVKLDQSDPVTADRIIALIDSMPMRRREAN